MNIEVCENIIRALIPMTTAVCLLGAVLLLLYSSDSRSRRLLAFTMLLWGLIYLFRTLGFTFKFFEPVSFGVFSPLILITGNFYVIVLFPYPLEVIRPGWFTLRRVTLLLLPYLAVVCVYVFGIIVSGQPPVKLYNGDDLLLHIREFNVWFRLVILFSVVGYLIYLLRLISRYEISYRQWCEANYASIENMEISWLRYYAIGVACIGILYFGMVFDGNLYCNIAHNLVVQIFFGMVLYKGLFHKNPYSEKFFSRMLNEQQARIEAEIEEKVPEMRIASEDSFLCKLPEYKSSVQQWLEEKKPYLRREFKLMDVAEVLPLNRSYLSRVFNEGFGKSFSQVVCSYRLQEAERLLIMQKEIPIKDIADRCGFSSPAVFYRVFSEYHKGVTPKEYRQQNAEH